jgi:hypothetical protein
MNGRFTVTYQDGIINYTRNVNTTLRYEPNNNTLNPNTQTRYKYTTGNVWLLSHGMKDNESSFVNMAKAIHTRDPQATIITLNWSESAYTLLPDPNNVDQSIQPIAREVARRLKTWGLTNAQSLNMAGHSMGTIMITEIAKAMRDQQGAGESNRLIYLDPPNYANVNGVGQWQFDVNDGESGNDSIYNKDIGYTTKVNANTMRAFTGVRKDGKTNFCGNMNLNKTAKENILIQFPDMDFGICNIHGGVHKSWTKMLADDNFIGNYVMQDQNIDIYATGIASYTKKTFVNNDEQDGFNAIIYSKGSNEENTKPQTITSWDGTKYQVSGRTTENEFYGFDYNSQGYISGSTTNIQDFQGNDKLSLQKNATEQIDSGLGNGTTVPLLVNINYQVKSGGAIKTWTTRNGVTGQTIEDMVTFESGGVTPQSYLDAQSTNEQTRKDSAIQLRNN